MAFPWASSANGALGISEIPKLIWGITIAPAAVKAPLFNHALLSNVFIMLLYLSLRVYILITFYWFGICAYISGGYYRIIGIAQVNVDVGIQIWEPFIKGGVADDVKFIVIKLTGIS